MASDSTKIVLKTFKHQINTDKSNNIKTTTIEKHTSKIKIFSSKAMYFLVSGLTY